ESQEALKHSDAFLFLSLASHRLPPGPLLDVCIDAVNRLAKRPRVTSTNRPVARSETRQVARSVPVRRGAAEFAPMRFPRLAVLQDSWFAQKVFQSFAVFR